jgi:hypothetical protein
MSEENQDFFFEGKLVPETVKQSIYKMDNTERANGNRTIFEEVMTGLLDEFLQKKNISLTKVEKYVNEKVRNMKTYVLYFKNESGEEFKCAYLGEKDSLQFGSTQILASSIIFTFAVYGCKYCMYKDKNCEYCDRKKFDKIFSPDLGLTIKHNMKEFTKVFGKESVKSIKNFCEGFCEYIRSKPVAEDKIKESNARKEPEIELPQEIIEITKIDSDVINYVIRMTTTLLGQYANNNKDIRNILSGYTNVEKSFLFVINQLQRCHNFVKAVKEDPEDIPEEIADILKSLNENDDISDDEYDDEDDDDDEENWKKGKQNDDE